MTEQELLKKYAKEAITSLVIFGIFVVTSIAAEFVARLVGQFGIVFRIVGWSISACGAICCIGLVVRNTIAFIKLLIKGPPKKTPGQDVVDEERDE